jgi:hypothetical protein
MSFHKHHLLPLPLDLSRSLQRSLVCSHPLDRSLARPLSLACSPPTNQDRATEHWHDSNDSKRPKTTAKRLQNEGRTNGNVYESNPTRRLTTNLTAPLLRRSCGMRLALARVSRGRLEAV